MFLISINLGIVNLLPIPLLDGGHLLLIGIQSIRKKPLDENSQYVANFIGLAFLISVMVLVFYNDIVERGIIEKWMN